ncbi:MAG: mechanosensitive ion channel family protein, partial [Halobacteriovoraceae bacterium]|nr:mechanosensitive ion channel family protein [Halobacteriovoraceae bacterium]
MQKSKITSLKKREINDAIETDSPTEEETDVEITEIGIEGIETRFAFISKVLPSFLLLSWIFFISAPYIGDIPATYISIVAAIVSVLAGFALRPFLENLFAGVVISFFRYIRVGDTVLIDDHYGIIEDIGLTCTILKQWDWNRIVIPNSRMLQKEIQNMTINDSYLWAHIEFFISPEADLAKVEKIALEASKKSNYISKTSPDIAFWVMGLEKDSIKCWAAAWADSPADAWELKTDMRTEI